MKHVVTPRAAGLDVKNGRIHAGYHNPVSPPAKRGFSGSSHRVSIGVRLNFPFPMTISFNRDG
jgi:hypothetical protein